MPILKESLNRKAKDQLEFFFAKLQKLDPDQCGIFKTDTNTDIWWFQNLILADIIFFLFFYTHKTETDSCICWGNMIMQFKNKLVLLISLPDSAQINWLYLWRSRPMWSIFATSTLVKRLKGVSLVPLLLFNLNLSDDTDTPVS